MIILNYMNTFSSLVLNQDENVHRFALSALRGEILEREGERARERERYGQR